MTIQWKSFAIVCVASADAHTDESPDDGPDGQVDAARGDHEGHADRDDAQDRRETQDRHEVVDAREPLAWR